METERLNIKGQVIYWDNWPLHEYFPDLESVAPIPIPQNNEGN